MRSHKKYADNKIEELKSLINPKWFISVCVDFLILNIQLTKYNENFESPYLSYKAELVSEAKEVLRAFTKIVWDNIIMSPHSQQLVKNGQIIVCHLFDVFDKNYQILPINTQEKIKSSTSPQRVISDYISGMTDRYALKMYDKIFGSEIISFFEK